MVFTGCLGGQHPGFEPAAPAKTAEFAVRPDDPVTRHGESDSIGGNRTGHGPDRARAADPFGQLAISGGRSGGNIEQRAPDLDLKFGAAKIQWGPTPGTRVESGVAEGAKLAFCFGYPRIRELRPESIHCLVAILLREVYVANTAIRARDETFSERTLKKVIFDASSGIRHCRTLDISRSAAGAIFGYPCRSSYQQIRFLKNLVGK
jgi:hypothetical protein